MKDDIAKLVKDVPQRAEQLTYYYELGPDALLGDLARRSSARCSRMLGLDNIADAADADGSKGGYPQLSAESLVKADPDLIFLADTKCCQQTADTVKARPGWAGITAVKTGQVVGARRRHRLPLGSARRRPAPADRRRGRQGAGLTNPTGSGRRAAQSVGRAPCRRRARLAARRASSAVRRRGSSPGWRSGRSRCRPVGVAAELLNLLPGRPPPQWTVRARGRDRHRAAAAPGRARAAGRRDAGPGRRLLPGRVPQPAGRPVPAGRRRPAPGSGSPR